MFRVRALATVVAVAVSATDAAAQAGVVRRPESIVQPSASNLTQSNSGSAFVIEALGASVGSLAGIGVGLALATSCGNDDLGCEILSVGAGGALGVVGATIGTTLAARATGSKRSAAGAALGSVIGTGVGLGIHWMLNKNSDRNLGDAVVVPIFVMSQGTFAALGSRLLGSSP